MRKHVLWMALTALIALQVSGANAATATFDWEYVGPNAFIFGIGTLQATDDGGGQYTVTSISGKANGLTVVGLSGYDLPDQLVFYNPPPGTPSIALDSGGVSFSVAGGNSFQFYEDDTLYTPGPPYGCGGVYCLLGPGAPGSPGPGDPFTTVDFSLTFVSETPLPAALPLFAAGLGVIGLFGLRRKRKNTPYSLDASV